MLTPPQLLYSGSCCRQYSPPGADAGPDPALDWPCASSKNSVVLFNNVSGLLTLTPKCFPVALPVHSRLTCKGRLGPAFCCKQRCRPLL